MTRWLLLVALAAGIGLAVPAAALADADAKLLKLVRSSSTSLRQAIQTAERDLKGRAYAAFATANTDTVTFTVKVIVGEKAMSGQVDGKTGKSQGFPSVLGESPAFLKDFAKVKGTLIAAVKAAEATAKGKAFDAAFKRPNGKLLFEVDVAGRDDVEKDVVIDALSGKIRKVAEKTVDAGATADGAQPASAAPAP